MTVRSSPALAGLQNAQVGAPGSLSAETHRLGTAGLFAPADGLHARSGILPAPLGYRGAVTLAGDTETLTVEPFRAVIRATQAADQGDYGIVNDAPVVVPIPGPHPSYGRIDVLVTYVRDTDYLPNEGQDDVVGPVLLPGDPDPEPLAPDLPPNCLHHGTLTVPASGQGPITWAPVTQPATVALGGIRPATDDELDDPGLYHGEPRYSSEGLELWNADTAEWEVVKGGGGGGTALAYDVQELTANGTWTKPVGAVQVQVELQGGGAGGGNAYRAYGSSGQDFPGGNGGGAGGRTLAVLRAADLAATVAVAIGSGGNGGTTDANGSNAVGAQNGGDTTFGGLTAGGGKTTSGNGLDQQPAGGAGTDPGGKGGTTTYYFGTTQSRTSILPGPGGGGHGSGGYSSSNPASTFTAPASPGGGPPQSPSAGAAVNTDATSWPGGLAAVGGGGGGVVTQTLWSVAGSLPAAGTVGRNGILGGGGGGGGIGSNRGGDGGRGGNGYARIVTLCVVSVEDPEQVPPAPYPNTEWDVQVFTASGTWAKPAGALAVEVAIIGAGGGGAGYTNSTGAGGGGGARLPLSLPASALPSTVPVTVGAAGTAGAAGAGGAGGLSSFGTFGTAYGGAAGGAAYAAGGLPAGWGGATQAGTQVIPEQGGIGSTGASVPGGSSVYGGGGGGGYGPNSPGGASGSLAGGAGAGGAVNTSGQPGQSRSGSGYAGSGGGGMNAGSGTPVGTGGAGGIPGGGGGAAYGTGGAGGRGEVVVRTLVVTSVGPAEGGLPALPVSARNVPGGVAGLDGTGHVLPAQLATVVAAKTANETKPTATLSADPALTVALEPGVYIVDGSLIYGSTWITGWINGSAGVTGQFAYRAQTPNSGVRPGVYGLGATFQHDYSGISGAYANEIGVMGRIVVPAGGGTITLSWAAATGTVTLYAGSFLRFEKVA